MDEEQAGSVTYTKVATHEQETEEVVPLAGESSDCSTRAPPPSDEDVSSTSLSPFQRTIGILHTTLITDQGIVVRDFPLVEGEFTIKFVKFLLLTFGSISLVHVIVARIFDDRDRSMTLWHIWHFDTNLIVMDSLLFFVVGRMWKQRGVDHLAWILPMVVCNIYFECQNYIGWLQHSVSLFEVHCLWPWQLWVFVFTLIPTVIALVVAHLRRAWNRRVLLIKLVEISICVFFFLAPVMTSPYMHFHHWFAGWLLGMHCNSDVWWSRAVMSYCWGMYINGIAVYGRDPVLTCEYAYFLSVDNRCPYTKCYLEALDDMAKHPNNATHVVEKMDPIDWKNCSASGYHP